MADLHNEAGGLARNLGTELVTLLVGPTSEEFKIHKGILCNISSYFSNLFNNGMVETTTQTVRLAEENVATIQYFLDYIYKGRLVAGTESSQVTEFYDLYIFAEMICDIKLKNMTMDAIRNLATTLGDAGEDPDEDVSWKHFVTPELMKKVFRKTYSYEGLQNFCIDLRVFGYWELWIKGGGVRSADDLIFSLAEEDLEELAAFAKDGYEDIFKKLYRRKEFQVSENENPDDPRSRKEAGLYHCKPKRPVLPDVTRKEGIYRVTEPRCTRLFGST